MGRFKRVLWLICLWSLFNVQQGLHLGDLYVKMEKHLTVNTLTFLKHKLNKKGLALCESIKHLLDGKLVLCSSSK